MCTEQVGELLGVFLSLIPPRALGEEDGHTGRELDKEGGTGTPREGEQSPQHCWGQPALTQPRPGLPSSQAELSEAKIISARSKICTEPQLSLLMTKGLETTAAPQAKGLK